MNRPPSPGLRRAPLRPAAPGLPYQSLTPADAGWEHLSFAAVALARGERWTHGTGPDECVMVILGGTCSVRSTRGSWERVGERATVFDGMPYALFFPRGTELTVTAESGQLDLACAWARALRDHEPRLVTPDQVEVELRLGERLDKDGWMHAVFRGLLRAIFLGVFGFLAVSGVAVAHGAELAFPYFAMLQAHRHVGFFLADAMGHGVAAGLLTMFIKEAIIGRRVRDNQSQVPSPSEVLTSLNADLAAQDLPNCQFVTACFGHLDLASHEVVFARACATTGVPFFTIPSTSATATRTLTAPSPSGSATES